MATFNLTTTSETQIKLTVDGVDFFFPAKVELGSDKRDDLVNKIETGLSITLTEDDKTALQTAIDAVDLSSNL
tara:strand:- start:4154 stop:4372 length:219 start_codon:yes stop_codon:yes gene_type:complete